MRLRYWIMSALKNSAIALIATAVYAPVWYIMSAQSDPGNLLLTVSVYLLTFGGSISMALNITAYKQNLPIALSFGSSRKEAAVGLQLFRLIPGAVVVGLAAVLFALAGNSSFLPVLWFVLIGLGIFLALGAFGSLSGLLLAKGEAGVFAAICPLVVGILMSIAIIFGPAAVAALWGEDFSLPGFLPWVIFLVGLAAHAGSTVPEFRAVYKLNVKL